MLERERHVVTKDDDFVQSHLISGRPKKLRLIATGNIGNVEFETLLRANFPAIARKLESATFVEIDRDALTVHG